MSAKLTPCTYCGHTPRLVRGERGVIVRCENVECTHRPEVISYANHALDPLPDADLRAAVKAWEKWAHEGLS